MYEDKRRIEQCKQVWLTEIADDLIVKEKIRLWEKEKRKLSKAKIVNNLILEKYGNS